MRIKAFTEPMPKWERRQRDLERVWERLSTLAHNLAIGGALCRAHRQGIEWHHTVPEMRWDPGCGRAAP